MYVGAHCNSIENGMQIFFCIFKSSVLCQLRFRLAWFDLTCFACDRPNERPTDRPTMLLTKCNVFLMKSCESHSMLCTSREHIRSYAYWLRLALILLYALLILVIGRDGRHHFISSTLIWCKCRRHTQREAHHCHCMGTHDLLLKVLCKLPLVVSLPSYNTFRLMICGISSDTVIIIVIIDVRLEIMLVYNNWTDWSNATELNCTNTQRQWTL